MAVLNGEDKAIMVIKKKNLKRGRKWKKEWKKFKN
jgi:hypothetical protein